MQVWQCLISGRWTSGKCVTVEDQTLRKGGARIDRLANWTHAPAQSGRLFWLLPALRVSRAQDADTFGTLRSDITETAAEMIAQPDKTGHGVGQRCV